MPTPKTCITYTKENIFKKLLKAGHSKERVEKIMNEAENSSDPVHILNYWGAKIKE